MREAQRQTEAEQSALTRSDERTRQRTEVRFADEPTEWRQLDLRSMRGMRDGVNRAAHQRSIG